MANTAPKTATAKKATPYVTETTEDVSTTENANTTPDADSTDPLEHSYNAVLLDTVDNLEEALEVVVAFLQHKYSYEFNNFVSNYKGN